jgi:protein-L-isoaspartate(D-aspartate) O-methyltransferase
MKILSYLFLICFLGIWCMKSDSNSLKKLELSDAEYTLEREHMVEHQIQARGINNSSVLNAMRSVPRHLFVPEEERARAYNDNPLPIGFDQTISQPFIVAFMTEMLSLTGDERVLEVGTGSGYQAAVLSTLSRDVFSIEIVPELCEQSSLLLAKLRYSNVRVKCGDGYAGWQEYAPFDAIMLTAAPPKIPQPLVDQLKVGGRMIVPVGKRFQELVLLTKLVGGNIEKKKLLPVRFVPMTGKIQEQ